MMFKAENSFFWPPFFGRLPIYGRFDPTTSKITKKSLKNLQNAINRPLKITEKSAKISITTPFFDHFSLFFIFFHQKIDPRQKIWGPIKNLRSDLKNLRGSREIFWGVPRNFLRGPGEFFLDLFRDGFWTIFNRKLIWNRLKKCGGDPMYTAPHFAIDFGGSGRNFLGPISTRGGPEEIFHQKSINLPVSPLILSFGPFRRVQLTNFPSILGSPREIFSASHVSIVILMSNGRDKGVRERENRVRE